MKIKKIKKLGSGESGEVWIIETENKVRTISEKIKRNGKNVRKKTTKLEKNRYVAKYFRTRRHYEQELEITSNLPNNGIFLTPVGIEHKIDCALLYQLLPDAKDLLEYVKENDLSKLEIRTILFDILVSLHILHRRRIFHLDIKLENVIYSPLDSAKDVEMDITLFEPEIVELPEEQLACSSGSSATRVVDVSMPMIKAKKRQGRAFVIDWDMSERLIKDGTITKKCGSVHYAAPELYSYSDCLGWPLDMWSFGVLAYGLLTNSFPFKGDVAYEILPSIREVIKTGFISAGLPETERSFISDILKLEPDFRLKPAEAILHPFFKEIIL